MWVISLKKRIFIICTVFCAAVLFASPSANAQQQLRAFSADKEAAAYKTAAAVSLGLGVALQISGIALFIYSTDFYFNTFKPLQSEAGFFYATQETKSDFENARSKYNILLISSVSLFTIGTAGTIIGIGFALSRQVNSLKSASAKNSSKADTFIAKLANSTSFDLSSSANFTLYPGYPTTVMFSFR